MNGIMDTRKTSGVSKAATKGDAAEGRPVSSAVKDELVGILGSAPKFMFQDVGEGNESFSASVEMGSHGYSSVSADTLSAGTTDVETVSDDERMSDVSLSDTGEALGNTGISATVQASNREDMGIRRDDQLAADLWRNVSKLDLSFSDGTTLCGKDVVGPKPILAALIHHDTGLNVEQRELALSTLEATTFGSDKEVASFLAMIPDDSQTLAVLKMSHQSMLAPGMAHMTGYFAEDFNGMPVENAAQRHVDVCLSPGEVKVQVSQAYEFKRDPFAALSDFTVKSVLDLSWGGSPSVLDSSLRFTSAKLEGLSGVSADNRRAIQERMLSLAVADTRTIDADAIGVRNKQLTIYNNALTTLLSKTSEPEKQALIRAEMDKVSEDIAAPLSLGDTSSTASAEKSLKKALGKKDNIAETQSRMESLLSNLDGGAKSVRSKIANGIKSFFSLPGFKHLLGWNVGLLAKGVAKAVGNPIKHDAEKLMQASREDFLNMGSDWTKKECVVAAGVTSTITPANASASGRVRNDKMEERALTGVTCQSNGSLTTGAANNQMTSLVRGETSIFSGVRHAIVATKKASPEIVTVMQGGKETKVSAMSGPDMANYLQRQQGVVDEKAMEKLTKLLEKGGESDIQEAHKKLAKLVANHNKAVDLLRSSLHQKLEGMVARGDDLSKPITVNLTSVSLVTPDSFRSGFGFVYHEKQMLAEQRDALQLLSQMSSEEKTALLSEFKGADGTPLFGGAIPELRVSAATFNFGVNELEQAGRANQNEMNTEAMTVLMSRVDARLGQLEDGPEKKLLEKMKAKTASAFEEYQSLGMLSGKQAMPYEMPVLVAALDNLCDGSLLFNCKSGKDRTGEFDVQTKIFLNQLHETLETGGDIDQSLRYFSRMDEAFSARESGAPGPDDAWLTDQQVFNRSMMNNSGNREVQEENTTGWGYKLEGGNTARMFNALFGVNNLSEVYGFSKLFGA